MLTLLDDTVTETDPADPGVTLRYARAPMRLGTAGLLIAAINELADTTILQSRFSLEKHAELGIEAREGGTRARDVITSCGSGTSATHHSLAMRVAGLPDPILYVGSYSDWSRSGEPVATGPEPGEPPG